MKLRRLEIAGFKSFADPMVIDFNANITGIIGPNGCGKSNVVDAIRWVMGELSAKQLRGSAMADVIFNGSEKRGPLGMAEVTLIMSNDGSDCPANYRAYEEIAVQRRLFSNGDSEYLINKTKVRLRDVQELFMDTGVGTKGAYAIIEQGRIGSILLGQAEERRRMIDEVAGISKFKARRQGAERRLEATMQSMERLDDLINDLKKRANTLRRQAEQARRYKELKIQLAEIEQAELVLRFLEASAQSFYYGQQQNSLSELEITSAAALSLNETRLSNLNIQKNSEDDKLRQLDAIKQHMVTRVATLERDILHCRQELELSLERQQNLEHDEAEAREQLERLKQNSVDMDLVVDHLQAEIAERQQILEQKQAELLGLQAEHRRQQREADSLAVAMLEAVEAITRQQNSIEMLGSQQEELKRRETQSQQIIADLEDEREEAAAKQKELATAVEQALGIIEEYNYQHDELKLETDRLQLKIKGQKANLDEQNQKLVKIRSRWESLEEIERRHDGYAAGTQSLLEKRDLVGMVTLLGKDLISLPAELELAAEALLGDLLQYIVVKDQDETLHSLSILKEHHLGKAGFILPAVETVACEYGQLDRAPGYLGIMADMVEFQYLGDRLSSYLKRVVVFDTIENCFPVAGELQKYQLTAVTLNGDVFEAGIFIRGGDRQSVSSGVLARQRELSELSAQLEEEELLQQNEAQKLASFEERFEQNNLRLQELVAAISRENLLRISKEKERQAAAFDVDRIDERISMIGYELEQSQSQQQQYAKLVLSAKEKLAAAEMEKEALSQRQSTIKDNSGSLSGQIGQLSEETSLLRIKLAEYNQKLEAVLASRRGQSQSVEELQARIEKLKSRQEKELESRQKNQQQLYKNEEEQQLYTEQITKAEGEVAKQYALIQEIIGQISTLDQQVHEDRAKYQELTKQLTDIRLLREKWLTEMRQLSETAQTFHQATIDDLVYKYHQAKLPTPASEKIKKKVQDELAAIGPNINLLAIEEYSKVDERLTFLQQQKADLEEAIDDLHQAIIKIEQSSRNRFNQAFTAVNEAFKKVFVKLFNGGQAELVLLDNESPLDGGLDIIAQPPGKRLQNLTLLSGGEKALTAAAMVFALFLVRPSPFCLLDEVDAPLDEANIGRFLDLIKELSVQTQFVIITHNQQTMGASDVVYGVTMEERGVSKVLSIKLKESENG